MSDLYTSLFKKLDPSRYNKLDDDGNAEPMNLAKMDLGMGFEARLEPQLESLYGGHRPGELFTQHGQDCAQFGTPVRTGLLCHCGAGVAYSPDWIFDHEPDLILGEFKCSWYSCREFPRHVKFAKWICQCQCYCKHLKIHRTWVFPYWVNGTYPKGAPSPLFDKAYELVFTQRELDDNWSALLRHAWKEGLIP